MRCLTPQVMRNKSALLGSRRKKLLSDIPINDDYPTLCGGHGDGGGRGGGQGGGRGVLLVQGGFY